MKTRAILIISLLFPFCVLAKNANDDVKNMLQAFTKCDGEFYSILKDKNYAQYFELLPINKTQATLKTDLISTSYFSEKRVQKFNSPINFGKIKIIQFNDERSIYSEDEKYYYWGFQFNNTLEEVRKAFNWINWHKDDHNLFVYAPLIYKNGKWQTNPSAANGIEPEKGTAEKVLLLSSYKGEVTVFCSIQGDIPQKELTKIRPDLKYGE